MTDPFERQIAGAVKDAINAHGAITHENSGSASKRIASLIREAIKRERDELFTTEPKGASALIDRIEELEDERALLLSKLDPSNEPLIPHEEVAKRVLSRED